MRDPKLIQGYVEKNELWKKVDCNHGGVGWTCFRTKMSRRCGLHIAWGTNAAHSPVDGGYIFAGEAYIDGVINGEAMVDLENGLYELEDFHLV
jgi:hypothetical protein